MQAEIITLDNGFQRVKITTDKGRKLFFDHLNGDNFNLSNNDDKFGFIIDDEYSFKEEESSFKNKFPGWWIFRNDDARDTISAIKDFFGNEVYSSFLKTIKHNNKKILKKAYLDFLNKKASEIQSAWKDFKTKKAEEQESAATKIQANWKGYKSQKEFKAMKDAAITIQSAWKGFKVRKDLAEQENAATTIQSAWNGYKAKELLKKMKTEEAAKREAQESEAKRLEELKLQMEREAKELQEARAAQDAKKQRELEQREAENAERLKAEKEALIKAREKNIAELARKLKASHNITRKEAKAKIEEAIEEKKPEPVKIMEAKFFICEVQPGRQLVMQYSSESSDGSEGSKGKPDHIKLLNHNGKYIVGPGSYLNGKEVQNIEINYPSQRGDTLKVLPSDIKAYAEIEPNLDMFYLALLCWNPRGIKTEVFSVENFDLDGFHYKGNEQFEQNSGMWKFEATMDNGFVGEALTKLAGEVEGGAAAAAE